MKSRKILFCLLLAGFCAAPMMLSACDAQPGTIQQSGTREPAPTSSDLMQGVTARALSDSPLSENLQTAFRMATADFSLELFRHAHEKDQNSLLSPISAGCALAMTANGAAGDTQSQFLSLLGDGVFSQDQLNQAYRTWITQLRGEQDGIVSLANSIWLRSNDGLVVNKEFLQANADSFDAGAYQMDFSDPATRDAINQWVSEHTNGKITKLVDQISPDTLLYLINTLYFEMDWKIPFEASGTHKQDFHISDQQKVSVDFMSSDSDDAFYIQGEQVQGIKKAYADERYSFLALLPDEGVSLEEYLSTLTGERFLALSRQKVTDPLPAQASWSQMKPPEDGEGSNPERHVRYQLPKFKYSYGKQLNDALQTMGLTDAFQGEADFSNLAPGTYIGQVLQKTFIEVDELGTKAGAATLVEIKERGAMISERSVDFDRPFLYAIVENDSGLPLFLGTVTNPLAQGES